MIISSDNITVFQVNISLAILFAIEGFHPKNEGGKTISHYSDFNSALPLLTFLLSLFASSFGISKFLISGPIQLLSKESAFNGLLSVPFLSLCLINTMFGFRVVSIENAFFSSYRIQKYDLTRFLFETEEVFPIFPPEYRLLVYLAPCFIPFLINLFKLLCTTEGMFKYFLMYPQFLVFPCFSPFMFEGYDDNESPGRYKLKVWRWGTLINALYIGCIPQLVLFIADYYKGVHHWKFNIDLIENSQIWTENNDALFKSQYGNTIFAATSIIFFLVLITIFFGSSFIFGERGFHCRCISILCCPCPQPCVHYIDQDSSSTSLTISPADCNMNQRLQEEVCSSNESETQDGQTHTMVYLYRDRGEKITVLFGKSSQKMKKVSSKSYLFLIFFFLF